MYMYHKTLKVFMLFFVFVTLRKTEKKTTNDLLLNKQVMVDSSEIAIKSHGTRTMRTIGILFIYL